MQPEDLPVPLVKAVVSSVLWVRKLVNKGRPNGGCLIAAALIEIKIPAAPNGRWKTVCLIDCVEYFVHCQWY